MESLQILITLLILSIFFLIYTYNNDQATLSCHLAHDTIQPVQATEAYIPTKIDRPSTLHIYSFYHSSPFSLSNLQYFMKHGMCEDCNVDFVFVVQEGTLDQIQIEQKSNIRIISTDMENMCEDIGPIEYSLSVVTTSYARYAFTSSFVRGPFLPPFYHYLSFGSQPAMHWTDLYGALITDYTKLVGSYISCHYEEANNGVAHVLLGSFMTDAKGLSIILPHLSCDEKENYYKGAIGISKAILEKGYNIGSSLSSFSEVDFVVKAHAKCNDGDDPTEPGKYFGGDVNPFESIFYFSSKKSRILELYSDWLESVNY